MVTELRYGVDTSLAGDEAPSRQFERGGALAGLYERLVKALRGGSPQTARELAAVLGTARSQVNSLLYSRADTFTHDGAQPPRWMLHREASTRIPAAANARGAPSPPSPSKRLGELRKSLYAWQRRALDDWASAGHQGVVEAVTGAGKTRVGLTAIGDGLANGFRVLVIVPTTVLLGQWQREISDHLGIQAGVLGGGRKATLSHHNVVVSTVQSASRIDRLLPRSARGLIVCDEVHRYGADSFARVLQLSFERRLGMTATFERNDDGLHTHLLPYFGRVVYSLWYREALEERVIARFRVAIVRVDLDPQDQQRYESAHEEARDARYKLVTHHRVTREPFGEFMAEVAALAEGSPREQATKLARRFLSNFSESRRILGETPSKLDALRHARDAVAASQGTLVFASTVAGARRAAQRLTDSGVDTETLDSSMTLQERRAVLGRFQRREVDAMAAPLVLDEGVDVPEANLAIILAASKTRRQMIQRLGRVVRVKADGGIAHLALVVARNTSEDPASGAHMGFIEEMLDVAHELRVFNTDQLPELASFLTGGDGGSEPDFTSTAAPSAVAAGRRPATTRQPTAADDHEALLERVRRSLPDLEGASDVARRSSSAARSRRKVGRAHSPLPLDLRIRDQLAKGPRTATRLASELGVPRELLMKVLVAAPEFVTRDLGWYLASNAPPAALSDRTDPSMMSDPGEEAPHPLVDAWESLVGPVTAGQRAHFEYAMRFVMPMISSQEEAREFVHEHVESILARLQK